MDIEYLNNEHINIPKFRNTIYLAGSYYESYPLKESLLDKFLSLIFSLESLFSKTTESTYRISMYASTLLAPFGPERSRIYEFLKKMIRNRNDLVHGKKSFIDLKMDETDVFELASYVRKSIMSFISLYLHEEKYNDKGLRDKFLGVLEKLTIGAEEYESFEKIKDLENLVDEMLAQI